ncbi:serine/threonine protein kinase [Nostoc parmelioides]|uniref:non-specific serine/threonine protein kinase n=1 Tax=Nostoc parmelioides FACHB-3921 TaxID=2692909 RepID=A0ABR8BHZ1_9NOSO|nr:serine/threonine-protein kinase [Nostoc parmelioides]MBD2253154.1 serine/threonine protein kinase [Nostoc parmelioides FACHB-3921]
MIWQSGHKLYRDKYEIKQELGRGQFAITYLAQDRNGKKVVIKTLNPSILNQLRNEERDHLKSGFADESRKLTICKHPHIVEVFETFHEGELLCMVMEYIQGTNLASLVNRVLPEKEALNYIQQIGQALIEVHKQRFLHRDIKPENIMIRAGKHETVLIDFDLAREFDNPLTSRGRQNHGFTPIELYSNSAVKKAERGPYTDVYSLAATLYVLLTGQQPVCAIDRKDKNERLIPPQELNHQISKRVNDAIIHAMELETDQRPQTVAAWLRELGLKTSWSPFSRLLIIQPLWIWILEIMGVLALFAALISGFKDGFDLWKDIFPNNPNQRNTPLSPTQPYKPYNNQKI